MRTQIAKTWYLPPSIFRLHFWLVPPPPIPQVDGGGCYREKFFIFFWIHYQLVLIILRFLFFFWFSLVISEVWIENIFLFSRFSHSISTRILFFYFSDFRLVYPILGFQLNSFTEYLRFNLFIFARYYLDYDSWLRFWISTRFPSHQFRLVSALSILCFNSLPL